MKRKRKFEVIPLAEALKQKDAASAPLTFRKQEPYMTYAANVAGKSRAARQASSGDLLRDSAFKKEGSQSR